MSQYAPLAAISVSKSLSGRRIVDSVDLTLAPGQVTALLGPSGAGKSTLLRLLAGLEDLDSGQVKIGETVLSEPGCTLPTEHRKTGLIFQDFALFPHMSALENVRFGLSNQPKAAGQSQAAEWLERLGLAHRAAAYPHQLSGGEQQRVAIARALAPAPTAILMDEPFSGLDPALRAEVAAITLDVLRASGPPVLLVSHDARAAMEQADILAVMRAGQLVQLGPPSDVYDDPVDAEVAAALGPVNRIPAHRAPATLTGDRNGLIIVREEAIRADPESSLKATILSSRRVGAQTRVKLRLDDLELTALMNAVDAHQVGESVAISFSRSGVFQFPLAHS